MFDSQKIYLLRELICFFCLFIYVQIYQTTVFPTMHIVPLETQMNRGALSWI